jgi:O-antigen/teichoic acid export membrane protein
MSDLYGVEAASTTGQDAQVDAGIDSSRIDGVADLRGHTARGTILNSGFQVSLTGLGLIQRLVVAAFLTRAEFGLWAVILTVLVNLSWLKDLGISDKYLQQSEPDQEVAFQKAFTLELYSSLAFFCFIALVLPLWAFAYGHQDLILPGIITALSIPINALQAPAWIPYRRLQYGRQRKLNLVGVLVGFVVTVTLAVAGAGYWCFVFGILVGSVAGAAVCWITSPYPLRLIFDRATARSYLSFSWPLVAAGLNVLLLVQGSLIVANWTVGITGVGVIGLVIGLVSFTDRVDTLIGQTIYPAICAVAGRLSLLEEVFVKANRVALMWAMPFAIGLALFAGDLITFVLGEKWRAAEGLLVVVSLSCGIGQVAFNWMMFLRALNRTRPIWVGSAIGLVVFLSVVIPGMLLYGLAGYGAAFAASTLVQLGVRSYYMRKLFGGFPMLRHTARAIAPAVPAAALVLLVRLLDGGHRTLPRAIAELALYAAVATGLTVVVERSLITEIVGYLRRRPGRESFGAIVTEARG